MARNMEGKFTKLRWSYIIGYVDSFDVVHSRIFSYESGDSIKMHYDLFGMVLKAWRWNFDKGVEASLGDRLEDGDWDRVREHLTEEYDIPFWSNGFHDIQFFIKKMDEEEGKL